MSLATAMFGGQRISGMTCVTPPTSMPNRAGLSRAVFCQTKPSHAEPCHNVSRRALPCHASPCHATPSRDALSVAWEIAEAKPNALPRQT